MTEQNTTLLAQLADAIPSAIAVDENAGRMDVRADDVPLVLGYVKDELGLDYLAELTAADYLMMPVDTPERFAVIYIVRSLESGQQVTIRAWVSEEEPEVESATALWQAADWLEREVFDMFGIAFRNHPNMIRILMPEDFDGHPLRKDFPVQGTGYRDEFRVVTREDA